MNKKAKSILGSILVVAVAVMLTYNGTESYLSDSEKSTSNVLTIGELDLKIDWVERWSAYEGILEQQMETDLTDNRAIFELDDVKPGDDGEATISLHVHNNDAWACIDIVPLYNDDMSSTEPELEVDSPEDPNNPMDGELAQNLDLLIWVDEGMTPGIQNSDDDPTNDDDEEGDNVWQEGETILFEGKATGLPLRSVPIDGNREEIGIQPLIGCQVYYIGFAWSIDYWDAGNEIQSDAFAFDMTFDVSQYRNQETSPCTPDIQRYPFDIGENVYIGYEDWTDGDFDYNDFGMRFNVTETYNQNGGLLEILMQFEAIIYDSGGDHYIHINRELNGDYCYTVTRTLNVFPYDPDEHPDGMFFGSGDFDIVLFDTNKYTQPSKQIGETVTVRICPNDPAANPLNIPATPPRDYDAGSGIFYDLDPFMGLYDPWEDPYGPGPSGYAAGEYHIEDTQIIGSTSNQGDTPDIIPIETEVPFILVVPYNDWIPPDEDTTITGPYYKFDDFYTGNGTPTDWYLPAQMRPGRNYVGDGGLSWGPYP